MAARNDNRLVFARRIGLLRNDRRGWKGDGRLSEGYPIKQTFIR